MATQDTPPTAAVRDTADKTTKTDTAPKPAPAAKPAAADKPKAAAKKPATAPKAAPVAKASPSSSAAAVLPLELLDPDHFANPRGPVDLDGAAFQELVQSIMGIGLLEPIVVGPALVQGGKHPIVAGWRRYHAAVKAKLKSVPVHQVDVTTAKDALLAGLAENLARDGMQPLAEARALRSLTKDHGMTQVEAGKKVGLSERIVRDRLQLLALPDAVATAVDAGAVKLEAVGTLQKLAKLSPAIASDVAGYLAGPDAQYTSSELAREETTIDVLDAAGIDETRLMALHVPVRHERLAKLRQRTYMPVRHERLAKLRQRTYMLTSVVEQPAIAADKVKEAIAAGRAIEISGRAYTADPALHEELVGAALNAYEERIKAAEKKTREDRKAQEQPAPKQSASAQDHEKELTRKREYLLARADAGNAELGMRLADKVKPGPWTEGPETLRLLLELSCGFGINGHEANYVRTLVEPEFRDAAGKRGKQGAADDLRHRIDEEARALPVTARIARQCRIAITLASFDDRVSTHSGAGRGSHVSDEVTAAALVLADKLDALPERARKLNAAHEQLRQARLDQQARKDQRRIVAELERGPAQLEALLTAVDSYEFRASSRGLADLVPRHRALRAIDTLEEQAVILVPTRTVDVGANAKPEHKIQLTGKASAFMEAWTGVEPQLAVIDPPMPEPPAAAAKPAAKRASVENEAVALIDRTPGITIPELAEKLGIAQNGLYRVLPELQKQGKVVKEGRGWRPAPAQDAVAQPEASR